MKFYMFCINCGTVTQFFYNENWKEWECLDCGRAYSWQIKEFRDFEGGE